MSARILHVITGLGMGGAEMALARLLRALNKEHQHRVLSLTTDEPVGREIRALGVPVDALGLRAGLPDPHLLTGAIAALRRFRPQIVHTWLYHADLIGSLASLFAGRPAVLWGVHFALAHAEDLKPATRAVVRINARLSRSIPRWIVYCASSGRVLHEALGYDARKSLVIPNGVDADQFRPDEAARQVVRTELGVPLAAPMIGLCARYHPNKDHASFLRAAGILTRARPDAHFLLWGKGVNQTNVALTALADEAGLTGRVHFLGLRDDSARLFAALDIAALSSVTEAQPTAVMEAMACGVPCAVTNVGDAAEIVAQTGHVVPPSDPEALARAWAELLDLSAANRKALGLAARRQVESSYSLAAMAAAYARVYWDIIFKSDENPAIR